MKPWYPNEADREFQAILNNIEDNQEEPLKSPRVFLERFLAPELDEMERVLALGQSGKHAGKMPELELAFHRMKMFGHLCQAGKELEKVDAETSAPHLILVAIRALLAARTFR